MKKTFSFSLVALLLLPVAVLSNEPSAFSAGDLNSPSPYGLTSNEKKILQTTQANSEQYEGMRSILDGYNSKIARMDERIRQLSEENTKLREYAEESRKVQMENQEKVKAVLAEMGTLIDSINKNSVSKEKFDQLASEVRGKGKTSPSTATDSSKTDPKAKQPASTTTTGTTTSASSVSTPKELASKDSAALLQEAEASLSKKSYAQAKVIYAELLKRNYKPAKVNFDLGEIAYEEKSYKGAIEYYKTSIDLFDKAPYTPSLLYHTGSSFEKLGKTKEAQNFYKALKDGYPNSPEAKKVK